MSTRIEPANSHGGTLHRRNSAFLALRIGRDGLGCRLIGGYRFLAGMILALFWLRSGLAHITNSYYFLSSIYSYEILGPPMGVAAAMGFPALQLILAAGLVIRRFVGGSCSSALHS